MYHPLRSSTEVVDLVGGLLFHVCPRRRPPQLLERLGFRISGWVQSIFLKPLAELLETGKKLEALGNFPLDLYERQVFNLKAVGPGRP